MGQCISGDKIAITNKIDSDKQREGREDKLTELKGQQISKVLHDSMNNSNESPELNFYSKIAEENGSLEVGIDDTSSPEVASTEVSHTPHRSETGRRSSIEVRRSNVKEKLQKVDREHKWVMLDQTNDAILGETEMLYNKNDTDVVSKCSSSRGIISKGATKITLAAQSILSIMSLLSTLLLSSIQAIFQRFNQFRSLLCSEEHRIDLLILSFIGLSICFFGNKFYTVVLAVELYRFIGYQMTTESLNDLKDDILIILEPIENKECCGLDCKSDVEFSTDKSSKLQILPILRSLELQRVVGALSGIHIGLFAVTATMTTPFARVVAVGLSTKSIIDKSAESYLQPVIGRMLPGYLNHWSKAITKSGLIAIAISLAWWAQQTLSCVHSASRGGALFTRSLAEYSKLFNYLNLNPEGTQLNEKLEILVVFLGASFQLIRGDEFPLAANLLLLPFTFSEWLMVHIINNYP